ncbi:MAG: glycoside hydrolase family 2 [Ruminococcaceae bacterium]|nr:glycoside hydrolase family 2 [Oscillospiraceae bacterium]
MKKIRTVRLKTPFEGEENAWDIYPRPQMRRDSFCSLNGDWELFSVKKNEKTYLGTIKVPFPPESALSGIEKTLGKNEKYLYAKTFSISADFLNERTLLHFGACDQIAKVTLNGVELGEHIGGYLPFSFDVSEQIRIGENTLSVEITDELDLEIPYGKQRKKRGGMWYTPISGIWQTVWMESVPANAIRSIKFTPSLMGVTVEIDGGEERKILTVETPNGLTEYRFQGKRAVIKLKDPILWTPEQPHLYPLTIKCGNDTVYSYFALRTFGTVWVNGKNYLALNGKPYFCHGLLDQGYYSDGIYLPASPEGFRFDIRTAKSLGFNMLRKHIKIEPEVFYHECDKQGIIVFQDMVNSGKYSFLFDTALPTIGRKKGVTHKASERRRELFESACEETLRLLYNHPCVCCYTIFNEGWGQYDADRMYEKLKALDPSRVFDSTSGWFEEEKSDVKSEHVYFKKLDLTPSEKPLFLSEFGGYSCKIKGHSFNLDKTYGYRFFEKREDFMNALEKLYLDEVIPMIERGLCATVLTQLSDVEDETNGLLTYDRQVLKTDGKRMVDISKTLFNAFEEQIQYVPKDEF